MTATATIATAADYRRVASEARTLRAAIASYSRPMDEALVALVVEREGQEGLDRLVAASAQYLADQRAALAPLAAAMGAWEADRCTRCSGTGDYMAPTSRMRRGRPVCFQCGGSGQRKG